MKTRLRPINQQAIVITGVSSEIGHAMVERAADRGARLVRLRECKDAIAEIADRFSAHEGRRPIGGEAGRLPDYDQPQRDPAGALYQPSAVTMFVGQTHGVGGREPQ